MKTPEEMAEEYANTKQLSYVERLVITKGFIDGYKAAKDRLLARFKSLLSSFAETSFNPNHTAWQMFDILNDQVADVCKVMPQWISVKDRLPNVEKTSRSLRRESSCVLIVSYDNVYVAHLCEDWSDREHFIFEACNCNCRAFDMEIDEWKLDQVTHWQPLPAPPKEEK